jgi:hypothetical protein
LQLYNNNVVAIHAFGFASPRYLTSIQIVGIAEGLRQRGFCPILVGHPRVPLESDLVANFTGIFSILESAYLISRCSAVICVDSGIKALASPFKVPVCEISHIPEDLMHLNGPYILDPFKYCGIIYWSPMSGSNNHRVVYPNNGIFSENDITKAKCIHSIPPDSILKTFDTLSVRGRL